MRVFHLGVSFDRHGQYGVAFLALNRTALPVLFGRDGPLSWRWWSTDGPVEIRGRRVDPWTPFAVTERPLHLSGARALRASGRVERKGWGADPRRDYRVLSFGRGPDPLLYRAPKVRLPKRLVVEGTTTEEVLDTLVDTLERYGAKTGRLAQWLDVRSGARTRPLLDALDRPQAARLLAAAPRPLRAGLFGRLGTTG